MFAGAIGLVVHVLVFVELRFVTKNFDKGLKERCECGIYCEYLHYPINSQGCL